MNEGVHEGQRLLSAETVRAMTTNQLTPEQIAVSSLFPNFFDTHGWGYGMSVVTAPDAVSPTPGRYGWIGGFGTSWNNDRSRDLTVIVMTQCTDFLFNGALERYHQAVYQATA
jgi:CubicO group peptidase (beta-lactamase class C family)